ncbi:NAD(P)/FAD-dependent oxidoreductase [Methanocella sp. CWC-04]|uniref:NAD(P)/FAD-dependent oxidoreductase n=1 Tax=Methanooceanicella nereidis TaxID=2052831 RepID=A0AAP2W5K2_9EURY|nr:NAD(P)/FAD-dependent oxidoreductase [Methanocella sp. CWC-04]MCD1295605.1 NAD(P)/FAD-dependent oxidoreductase [Methanocella sp. CWC-04]
MKKDILEKGAILQRDKETYAVAPHIPGGICSSDTLRKIADISDKYKAAAIKITGAQRIAIVGLKEEDLDNVWKDLGLEPGAAVGMCVRSIKVCPGTTFCKRGLQDSVNLGLALDNAYHGLSTPAKFKIGVSGCPNSCGESWLKDLGFIGTGKGFKVIVGGDAGRTPRIGTELVDGLTIEQSRDMAEKIINYYRTHADKGERMGAFIERIGFEEFKKIMLG